MWAKLLTVLLVVATLPNSLLYYRESYSKFQKDLRIASTIVTGVSNQLAVKRSSEQEDTNVVCIKCLLDWSLQNESWSARITGKGKTFNTKLPEQDMTTERLMLRRLYCTGRVSMMPNHDKYKMMTLCVIIDNSNDSYSEMKQD